MFEVEIEKDFAGAHYLRKYDGDCANLHGHNWRVLVTAKAEELNELGIAIDFKVLKREVDALLDELDHKCINELDYFAETNPTAENLAKFLYDNLSDKINDDRVSIAKVRVYETSTSVATYYR